MMTRTKFRVIPNLGKALKNLATKKWSTPTRMLIIPRDCLEKESWMIKRCRAGLLTILNGKRINSWSRTLKMKEAINVKVQAKGKSLIHFQNQLFKDSKSTISVETNMKLSNCLRSTTNLTPRSSLITMKPRGNKMMRGKWFHNFQFYSEPDSKKYTIRSFRTRSALI